MAISLAPCAMTSHIQYCRSWASTGSAILMPVTPCPAWSSPIHQRFWKLWPEERVKSRPAEASVRPWVAWMLSVSDRSTFQKRWRFGRHLPVIRFAIAVRGEVNRPGTVGVAADGVAAVRGAYRVNACLQVAGQLIGDEGSPVHVIGVRKDGAGSAVAAPDPSFQIAIPRRVQRIQRRVLRPQPGGTAPGYPDRNKIPDCGATGNPPN